MASNPALPGARRPPRRAKERRPNSLVRPDPLRDKRTRSAARCGRAHSIPIASVAFRSLPTPRAAVRHRRRTYESRQHGLRSAAIPATEAKWERRHVRASRARSSSDPPLRTTKFGAPKDEESIPCPGHQARRAPLANPRTERASGSSVEESSLSRRPIVVPGSLCDTSREVSR